MEFLAQQQREPLGRRYSAVPSLVAKELSERGLLFVVRPRTAADDIRPALNVAASIAAHMESLGLTAIRRYPCTVRVENEDIPRFFPKFKAAIQALGMTATEGKSDGFDPYWWGFEIHDSGGALKGVAALMERGARLAGWPATRNRRGRIPPVR